VIALAPEPGKHDPTLPPVFSRGTNQENWAMRNSEPRQLELFGDLQRDDPVATYYRRCRKSGVSLHYDLAGDEVFVVRPRGVPRWAVAGIGPLRDRVVADLLRVQYGVLPFVEPETLDGGCQLDRLPGVLLPELQPPVRQSLTSARRDPGPLPDELT
jgi:hypothetical protein